jgi:hypothetical protein
LFFFPQVSVKVDEKGDKYKLSNSRKENVEELVQIIELTQKALKLEHLKTSFFVNVTNSRILRATTGHIQLDFILFVRVKIFGGNLGSKLLGEAPINFISRFKHFSK